MIGVDHHTNSDPRPKKRVFDDLTNSPPRVSQVVPIVNGTRPRTPASASVQRFSMKSRRISSSACVNQFCVGNPMARAPPRRGENSLDLVKIRPSAWQRDVVCGRRVLYQQNTNGHGEYELLTTMRYLFADECDCDNLGFNKASLQELDVYFIVQPNDVAVGYVAFRQVANLFSGKESPDATVEDARSSKQLLMLSEVYVKPEYRRKGMAAAALCVLLAGRRSVAISEAVVDTPARAFCTRLLYQLGFKERGRALFTRRLTTLKTVQDENEI